jgi:hypothetical protein
MQDIRSLFPEGCNPFYAGFGNRDTDEISYLKVGIPKGKIFIINPKVSNLGLRKKNFPHFSLICNWSTSSVKKSVGLKES